MMRSKRKRLRQKPLKTLAELVEFARARFWARQKTEEPIDFKDLSSEAQKSIEDGLASAKRGEVRPWARNFTRETDAIEDDSFDIEDVCSPSEARRRCDEARDKLAEMVRPKAPKPR